MVHEMVSIKRVVETAKIMWVKRYCNDVDAKWKILAADLMAFEKHALLKKHSIYNIREMAKTSFYANLLCI